MRTRLVLAVVLVAVVASPAAAYRIDEDGFGHALHWAAGDRPVGYRVVAASVPDGAAGEEAIRRAAAGWSGVTGRFAFRFAGGAAEVRPRADGRNDVGWAWRDWPYDPVLVATTARSYRTDDGRIVDADVLLNAENHAWSTGGGGFDVESAVAHELGHVAGLGHSEVGEATMYGSTAAGETHKRSLEDDDRSGLVALYGTASSTEASAEGLTATDAGGGGGGGGGCAIAGGGGNRHEVLLVIALAVLAGAARRGRERREREAARPAPGSFAGPDSPRPGQGSRRTVRAGPSITA